MSLPIGFFAPLPLPMMIPFMGIQSAVMAEQFGTMFQYGKRRISAMSNEEFNALTFEKLQSQMTTQLQGMIPQMQQQIQAMKPLVEIILKEFGNYILLAEKVIRGELLKEGSAFDQIAHLAGLHTHDGQLTPQITQTSPISDHDDAQHSKTGRFDQEWYNRLSDYEKAQFGTGGKNFFITLTDEISVTDTTELPITGTESQKGDPQEAILIQEIKALDAWVQKHANLLSNAMSAYSNAIATDGVGSPLANRESLSIAEYTNIVNTDTKKLLALRTSFQQTYGYYV